MKWLGIIVDSLIMAFSFVSRCRHRRRPAAHFNRRFKVNCNLYAAATKNYKFEFVLKIDTGEEKSWHTHRKTFIRDREVATKGY